MKSKDRGDGSPPVLRKLQFKIILMNSLLVGTVLLIVFAVFCFNVYHAGMNRCSKELSTALEAVINSRNGPQEVTGDGPSPDSEGQGDTLSPSDVMDVMVITVDSNDNICSIDSKNMTLSDSTLTSLVETAADNSFGEVHTIADSHLAYKALQNGGYTYIAVTSLARLSEDLHSDILRSIVLWFAFMVVFQIINIAMTRFSLKPVRRSWEKQHRFVADASHELKTPLTVILANNSILLEDEDQIPPSERQWIESTQEEALHMQTLISHLLFLARSDSGEQKVILQDLCISDMVEDDVLQFEPVAFERGIRIESDIAPDLHMEGDATMIKQLSHILLDNACKYSDDNGTITCSLKPDKNGIVLSVHNDGKSIPSEDLPHIFERFYRGDKARTFTESTTGYGLGLSIAKSIAEDHDGVISAESSPEKGTTFTVRFKKRLKSRPVENSGTPSE